MSQAQHLRLQCQGVERNFQRHSPATVGGMLTADAAPLIDWARGVRAHIGCDDQAAFGPLHLRLFGCRQLLWAGCLWLRRFDLRRLACTTTLDA